MAATPRAGGPPPAGGERTAMPARAFGFTRPGKYALGILGVLILAAGFALGRSGLAAVRAFASDAGCRDTVTLASAPAQSGKACTFYPGTVGRAYTTYGKRSSTHHLVFRATAGGGFDIPLSSNDATSTYDDARAAPGFPAVVETLDGDPIWIATRDRAVASNADPRGRVGSAAVFSLVGTICVLAAAFVPLRRPATSAERMTPRSRGR